MFHSFFRGESSSDLFRRGSGDYGERCHVSGDHAARGHNCPSADSNRGKDDGSKADPVVALEDRNASQIFALRLSDPPSAPDSGPDLMHIVISAANDAYIVGDHRARSNASVYLDGTSLANVNVIVYG